MENDEETTNFVEEVVEQAPKALSQGRRPSRENNVVLNEAPVVDPSAVIELGEPQRLSSRSRRMPVVVDQPMKMPSRKSVPPIPSRKEMISKSETAPTLNDGEDIAYITPITPSKSKSRSKRNSQLQVAPFAQQVNVDSSETVIEPVTLTSSGRRKLGFKDDGPEIIASFTEVPSGDAPTLVNKISSPKSKKQTHEEEAIFGKQSDEDKQKDAEEYEKRVREAEEKKVEADKKKEGLTGSLGIKDAEKKEEEESESKKAKRLKEEADKLAVLVPKTKSQEERETKEKKDKETAEGSVKKDDEKKEVGSTVIGVDGKRAGDKSVINGDTIYKFHDGNGGFYYVNDTTGDKVNEDGTIIPETPSKRARRIDKQVIANNPEANKTEPAAGSTTKPDEKKPESDSEKRKKVKEDIDKKVKEEAAKKQSATTSVYGIFTGDKYKGTDGHSVYTIYDGKGGYYYVNSSNELVNKDGVKLTETTSSKNARTAIQDKLNKDEVVKLWGNASDAAEVVSKKLEPFGAVTSHMIKSIASGLKKPVWSLGRAVGNATNAITNDVRNQTANRHNLHGLVGAGHTKDSRGRTVRASSLFKTGKDYSALTNRNTGTRDFSALVNKNNSAKDANGSINGHRNTAGNAEGSINGHRNTAGDASGSINGVRHTANDASGSINGARHTANNAEGSIVGNHSRRDSTGSFTGGAMKDARGSIVGNTKNKEGSIVGNGRDPTIAIAGIVKRSLVIGDTPEPKLDEYGQPVIEYSEDGTPKPQMQHTNRQMMIGGKTGNAIGVLQNGKAGHTSRIIRPGIQNKNIAEIGVRKQGNVIGVGNAGKTMDFGANAGHTSRIMRGNAGQEVNLGDNAGKTMDFGTNAGHTSRIMRGTVKPKEMNGALQASEDGNIGIANVTPSQMGHMAEQYRQEGNTIGIHGGNTDGVMRGYGKKEGNPVAAGPNGGHTSRIMRGTTKKEGNPVAAGANGGHTSRILRGTTKKEGNPVVTGTNGGHTSMIMRGSVDAKKTTTMMDYAAEIGSHPSGMMRCKAGEAKIGNPVPAGEKGGHPSGILRTGAPKRKTGNKMATGVKGGHPSGIMRGNTTEKTGHPSGIMRGNFSKPVFAAQVTNFPTIDAQTNTPRNTGIANIIIPAYRAPSILPPRGFNIPSARHIDIPIPSPTASAPPVSRNMIATPSPMTDPRTGEIPDAIKEDKIRNGLSFSNARRI